MHTTETSIEPARAPSATERLSPALAKAALGFAAIAVVVGGLVRFHEIGRKYFWFDEVHTAACVAGRPVGLIDDLFDGKPRHLAELRDMLRLRRDEPVTTTVDAILAGTPEHTPVYYVLLRLWAIAFGDSPATLRGFSAAINLASLVLLWALCRELFASKWPAVVATAWWSLSPFFVIHSQEARAYTLMAAVVLAAHLQLLRALRLGTWRSWIAYGGIACFGLYTHMFLGIMQISHAVYVLLVTRAEPERAARRALLIRFGMVSAAAVVLFLPWFGLFLKHGKHDLLFSLLAQRMSLAILMQSWFQAAGTLLFDFGLSGAYAIYALSVAIASAATALVIWSWIVLRREAPPQVVRFLGATAFVPPLVLIVVDLLTGGERSRIVRYWVPGLVTMGLIPCYVLGMRIAAGKRWALATAMIWAAVTTATGLRMTYHTTWWHKGGVVGSIGFFLEEDQRLRRIFAQMDVFQRPVLVYEYDPLKPFEILAMSTIASDKQEWIGVRPNGKILVPPGAELVVFRSPDLVERLKRSGCKMESLEATDKFFHCVPPPRPARATPSAQRTAPPAQGIAPHTQDSPQQEPTK